MTSLYSPPCAASLLIDTARELDRQDDLDQTQPKIHRHHQSIMLSTGATRLRSTTQPMIGGGVT